MKIITKLTGAKGSPLLMHNVRLADPTDPITMAIAAITKKGNKQTDADRAEVARLEFFGGIYGNGSGPVMPTANVRKTFIVAGRQTKEGKDVEAGLIATTSEVPLHYKGPKTIQDLWASGDFAYRCMVGVNRGKVSRTRPQFRDWSIEVSWELVEETITFEIFAEIVRRAGVQIGLCDGRSLGFGRFDAEVKKA